MKTSQLKLLITEAIKEAGISRNARILNPGNQEWDEIQKVLASMNLPKREPVAMPSKPSKVAKDEPSVEGRPVQRSKHPAKIYSPEEMDVLRKAIEILRSKDEK